MNEENYTVLNIDDDPDILALVKVSLKKYNCKVTPATTAEEAMKVLENMNPDLILLDVNMPGMNGYEFCYNLQKLPKYAFIPIIFLTASETKADKAQAFAVGGVDFISKLAGKKKLVETIRKHLENKNKWTRGLQRDKILRGEGTKFRPNFSKFKKYFSSKIYPLIPEMIEDIANLTMSEIYSLSEKYSISNDQIAQYIAEFLQISYLEKITSEDIKLGVIPTAFCRNNHVVALKSDEKAHCFALSNPFDLNVIDFINQISQGKDIIFLVVEPEKISALLTYKSEMTKKVQVKRSMIYQTGISMEEISKRISKEYTDEKLDRMENVNDNAQEHIKPLILLVDRIIENAYRQGASDIHIEPWEEKVVVRYRVDGNLKTVHELTPKSLVRPMVARLKIMAEMDISERRLPQDGRIIFKNFSSNRLDFDLRVSTVPSTYGEKVVMRILDKQKSVLPLTELGFSSRNLEIYREKILTPYGMILHVGPTGSGKSMTLYAALNEIKRPEINIQTIEDPVEYTLPGITQVQTHARIGLDFKRVLRSFLRQDPDVILIGEIRDLETAKISVEASLTGHMIFSTLHTNDAPSTITRFIEVGIEPFMISSTIVMVCAQRLLRRLCEKCKKVCTRRERDAISWI